MSTDLDILHPDDVVYLRRALELAAQAVGQTSPNPMVGCVVVNDGKIVGEGAHYYAGQDHAEIVALRDAGAAAVGSTVYVTLEPCCTFGRTPPCTQALVAAGVKKVVACMKDPNPNHQGDGFGHLLGDGIILRWGLLKDEAATLIRAFTKVQTTGLPFVTLKVASSLDGKVATASGDSRGLSGPEAQYFVHQLRATVDAIVIGSGTLIADNPQLTTRWEEWADYAAPIPPNVIPFAAPAERTPVRIVVSMELGFAPDKYKLFQTAREHPVYVVTRKTAPKATLQMLEQMGVRLIFAKSSRTGMDLRAVMQAIAQAGINHCLVEAGGRLLAPLFAEQLWDELLHLQAPVILGGTEAPGWVAGKGVKRIAQGLPLRRTDSLMLGADLLQRFEPATD